MKRLITLGVVMLLAVTSATVSAHTGFSFSIGAEGVSVSVNSYPGYSHYPKGHRSYRPVTPPTNHRQDKKAKKYIKKQRKINEKYRKESFKNHMKYSKHRHYDYDDD